MKKSVKLILAIVVLILLIVALKVVPASSDKTDEAGTPTASETPSEEAMIPVLSFDENEVAAIDIHTSMQTLTYIPPTEGKETWQLKGYDQFKLSSTSIKYRIKNALSLGASRVLENVNLNEYGLDKPSKTITYHLTAGGNKELLIGNATVDQESVYAMLAGETNKIYLISNMLIRSLSTDLSDYLDTTLSDFDPKSFSIRSLEVSGTDMSPVSIKLSEAQNGVIACYDFTSEQYKDVTVSNSTFETIKSILPAFDEIQSFVAAKVSDLTPYGLDKPNLQLIINYAVNDGQDTTLSTETLKLTFGKVLANGKTAFMLGDDTTNVYAMDASFIEDFKPLFTPFSLCDKYLAIPNISDVKAIDIEFIDTKSSYHLDVDHENTTYSCNGKNIKEADFKPLYRSIIGIVADKQFEQQSPFTTPCVTINYSMNDGSVRKVSVVPSADDQYYETYLFDSILVGCSKKQFSDLKTALDTIGADTISN